MRCVGRKKKGLKVNAGKSEVVVLGWEEGLEYVICVDGIRLEHVSDFKYLQCVLDESGTDEAERSRKVVRERRVVWFLVNGRGLELECARILHESLLVPVNGNRKLLCKEVSNAKGGKVENSKRIKNGHGSLAQGED